MGVEKCDESSTTNNCFVKWRAMCPEPLDLFTADGWNHVCDFVHKQQTWIAPNTDKYPNEQETRTPMLDAKMCNQVNGKGANNPNYGFKAAAVWKIKASTPLAVLCMVFAVL